MSDQNVTDATTDDTNVDKGTEEESPAISTKSDESAEKDKETKEESETTDESKEEGKEEGKEEPEKEGAPDDYGDFELPEGYTLNEESKDMVVTLAKELDLTKTQAQKMVDKYIEASVASAKAQDDANLKAWEETKVAWESELKKEWGDSYESNNKLVDKTIERFFTTKEAKEYVDQSGFNLTPHIKRAFVLIGSKISEDTFVPPGNKGEQDLEKVKKYSELLPQGIQT
jgi:hypothetical protein